MREITSNFFGAGEFKFMKARKSMCCAEQAACLSNGTALPRKHRFILVFSRRESALGKFVKYFLVISDTTSLRKREFIFPSNFAARKIHVKNYVEKFTKSVNV